jgi:hypothetical protein
MTSPEPAVPAFVYRYEVTASDHPDVPVGAHLADTRRDPVKAWATLDRTTGDMHTFVGERRARCCSECYVLHRRVRDYDHDGEHGDSPPCTPAAGRPSGSGSGAATVTALPPPGAVPGASLEILLAALHLLRSQADLFAGYIATVPPANEAHQALGAYVRGRCEEIMLEVDLHLSMLSHGATA